MRRVLAIVVVVALAGVGAFVLLRSGEAGETLTAPVERHLSRHDLAAARAERESIRGRLDAGWNDYLDGVFLLMDGKYGEAATVLARAREAHPSSWKITVTAASAAANSGRFKEASAMIESYVAAHPDDERGLVVSAEYLLDGRDGGPRAAEALARLDRVAAPQMRVAPAGDPTAVLDATLHRLRAQALIELGRHVEAIHEARAATTGAPNDAESWFVLGQATRLAVPPQGEESLDAYGRALTLMPQSRRYGEQFVMATLKLVVPGTEAHRFARALGAVEMMLRASPDDPALLILKARILARDQKTLDAANDLYADLQKRPLPKPQRLEVLRNRGVLVYDFKVGGQPGAYLKDSYELLRQYVDEGGVIDAELAKPWAELQRYAEKR
jgi:predicted Zn-dependent protease